MGQLRNTIRTMVRNEFAARMVEEAKKSTKKGYDAKTVYRSSKYIDMWNDLDKGKPTLTITPEATKFDFVRRMVSLLNKADQERSTAPIYLEPEQKAEALKLLKPLVNDPDEFVEVMNKERGIVFGQAYGETVGGKLRSHPDPVAYLLTQYLSDKDVLKSMEKVEPDAPAASAAGTAEEGEYDIIPGTTSKADISRMLSQDPTETTTEMSVLNRLKKAMKHLTNDQNMAVLEFIKDPDMDSADKKELIGNLEKLTKLVGDTAGKYSEMFVDAHIAAAKAIKDVENFDQVEKARTQGNKKFIDALKSAGVFSPAVNRGKINPAEYDVFDAVLDTQEGRMDVHGMITIAAKKPAQAELFRDEAIAAAKEAFVGEQDKQTNFNTLGDFTDTLPAVKEIRRQIFSTLSKRGRKKGSTKEVLAAKKAAAGKKK
jgi:hypothetical protein